MSTPANPLHKHTNRLAQATSPYLLQHAHNPVDWYPWGAQAIDRARNENKPIFLSVGYSTCYWCHVMERQSFENEQIAAQMNDKFVCIKVDREERPDVDQLYMIAVQILTRQGGWPMSVFLTPDLKPFFGGTYFPPEDSHGRPGFPRVLNSISAAYHTKREQVDKSASEIVSMLEKVAHPRTPQEALKVDLPFIESLIERSTSDYEQCFGGFGNAPKFPRQTLLEMLLDYTASPHATDDAQQIKAQVLYTLDYMAEGGIRDQLGGGFHRYSTDEKWLVPHFEIMLYDNAMLAVVYVQAWQQTQNNNYAKIARGILDFVLREMTGPSGEFYTAFDAEVDGQEGLNYLWTEEQVTEVLAGFSNEDQNLFSEVYGLSAGPNFADPHHGNGQPDKNILHLPKPLANIAKSLNITEDALDTRLLPMRQALYIARQARKQPLLDTKILTSWNALMIRAFAFAGKALNEPRYTSAGAKAATFLFDHHRQSDCSLVRTSRPGSGPNQSAKIPGFLDDYAFLTRALLALHDATGDAHWRKNARELADIMKQKFLDPERGGFYFTAADATDLIVRQKTASDSPLPSGNAVAAQCLLELGEPETARQVLAVFAQSLEDQAEGMSSMVGAALAFLEQHEPFTVSTQGRETDRPRTPDEQAKAAVELLAEWASPTHLRLAIEVMENYHINSNRPAQGLIPTTLAVLGPRGAELSATIEFPDPEERQFDFAAEPLNVYEGVVVVEITLDEPLPPGTPVRAVVTYQACTQDACLPATSKETRIAAP
jgi:uncharacterized protein YyaL (SSP411 family)